jgi:hypothetical protein
MPWRAKRRPNRTGKLCKFGRPIRREGNFGPIMPSTGTANGPIGAKLQTGNRGPAENWLSRAEIWRHFGVNSKKKCLLRFNCNPNNGQIHEHPRNGHGIQGNSAQCQWPIEAGILVQCIQLKLFFNNEIFITKCINLNKNHFKNYNFNIFKFNVIYSRIVAHFR